MPLNSGLCEESAVALYIIKKRKKDKKEKKKKIERHMIMWAVLICLQPKCKHDS